MTKQELISQVTNRNQSGAHVGDLIVYTLSGLGLVEQTYARARADAYGLTDGLNLPKIPVRSAYSRGLRAAINHCAGTEADRRRFDIRRVQENKVALVHQVIDITVETDDTISVLTDRAAKSHVVCTFKLSKDDTLPVETRVECDNWTHPVAIAFKRYYDEMAVSYLARDIRDRSGKLLASLDAVKLPGSEAVIVPACYADKVNAWERWLADLGFRPSIVPMFANERTLNTMTVAAAETLEGQLAKLNQEIEEFCTTGKSRRSTLEARVEAFNSLRVRAELYEGLLSMSLGDLKTRAAAAQEALQRSIVDMFDETGEGEPELTVENDDPCEY